MNPDEMTMFADKADMARRRASVAKAMKELDKPREEIARKYPNQPDSVDLIREDRGIDEEVVGRRHAKPDSEEHSRRYL